MRQTVRLMAAIAVVSFPFCARASMSVDLTFDNISYLQFESVIAKLEVKNESNVPLLIGGISKRTTVQVTVKDKDDKVVERKTKGLFVRNVIVPGGETREMKVDIGTHFGIQGLGQYHVSAKVVSGKREYLAGTKAFDIVTGVEILALKRSVPNLPDRIRTYSLRYWDRANGEHLFLHVRDDAEGLVYGTFDLGRVIRFGKPNMTVTVKGEIEIKHQSGRNSSTLSYFQSTSEGVLFLGQKQETVRKGPVTDLRLKRAEEVDSKEPKKKKKK